MSDRITEVTVFSGSRPQPEEAFYRYRDGSITKPNKVKTHFSFIITEKDLLIIYRMDEWTDEDEIDRRHLSVEDAFREWDTIEVKEDGKIIDRQKKFVH